MNRIVFLTEAGDGIGLGHFSRCSSLAEFLVKKDVPVEMYVYFKGEINHSFFSKSNFKIEFLDWKENNDFIRHNDSIIIDSYLADLKVYEVIQSKTKQTLAFDDYCRLVYPSSVVLNPNLSAKSASYDYKKETELLVGGKYVILRDAFRNLQIELLEKEVSDIAVVVGGSDYRNLMPNLIKKLCAELPDIQFHFLAITEEYKSRLEEIAMVNASIYSFLTAEEMKSLFVKCDLAVSASGQTLSELVVTKTPFVSFIIDDDQEPLGQFYFENDIVSSKIYWDDANFYKQIISSLKDLCDFQNRKEFVRKTQNIIDGKGVERICETILNLKNEF